MADLLCALHLLTAPENEPFSAPYAITIANGHALCEDCLIATAIVRTDNGGTVALSLVTDHRMRPA